MANTSFLGQTISCLLIQPNPDSALNSSAGHLLQDDYEAFAHQAKLMTSIHARIPPHMKNAVLAAKRRGEPAGTVIKNELDERPVVKPKSSSSSTMVMKRPQTLTTPLPEVLRNTYTVPASQRAEPDENSDAEEEDEASASKENDPPQCPSSLTAQIARRSDLTKRPLSDLPTPTEAEINDEDALGLSPSDRNIANNAPYFSVPLATSFESSRQTLKLAERSRSVNFTSRGLLDASKDGLAIVPLDINADESEEPPATKRLCLWEGKENATENQGPERLTAPVARPAFLSGASGTTKSAAGPTKKLASMPTVNSRSARARIGLRRL